MKCLKKESRSLFDLFKIYSCSDCDNYQSDYFFYIGYNIIAIYYLNDCSLIDINDSEQIFYNSEKAKRLIYDAVFYKDQIQLFIFDKFEIENYFTIFDQINDLGLDIQILTIC